VLLDTDGDRLLLVADRLSLTGGDEVDHWKKLTIRTSDEYQEFDERGLVIEIISRRTGAPERVLVAPETGAGRGDERTAALYGDLLAVRGNSDNTVVYRVSDGKRLMAFFGKAIAGDEGMGLVAATNQPQDVTVYEAATGKEVVHVTLDHYPLAARFIPEKRQLLVLTATQHVYVLDLPAVAPAQTALSRP
jgi:hypothetical protein